MLAVRRLAGGWCASSTARDMPGAACCMWPLWSSSLGRPLSLCARSNSMRSRSDLARCEGAVRVGSGARATAEIAAPHASAAAHPA